MAKHKIYFSDNFKESYKKIVRRQADVSFSILECLIIFFQDPFTPSLRTHKLKGQLSNFYAFSVLTDFRIIFRFDDYGDIVIVDIGSHDEVY